MHSDKMNFRHPLSALESRVFKIRCVNYWLPVVCVTDRERKLEMNLSRGIYLGEKQTLLKTTAIFACTQLLLYQSEE